MHSFDGPREATIQFSDVFGDVPAVEANRAMSLADFDAVLTAQVRNTNRWQDAHFSIGAWPALGDYAAVLLDQLREDQLATLRKQGVETTQEPSEDLHPDTRSLVMSARNTLVAVVNCAPRRSDHHASGANGDEFHVGVTKSGVEIYAQLPFFSGLQARGRLGSLHRIPNDAGVWPAGEQFRSSIVSQARIKPTVLVAVDLADIPKTNLSGRVAYADKFGNVRLEMANGSETASKLEGKQKVSLSVGDVTISDIYVVSRLTEIPEGQLGIYHNPADPLTGSGPHYVELVRRVSNPNTHEGHAYATLVECLSKSGSAFTPDLWATTDVRIV